jgi:O-antigen/teichoic acid export membrane protein
MSEKSMIGRNTIWASVASMSQFGATAIVLLLLTHVYPPEVFGPYVAALGLVLFISPFAGLGAPSLLHKRFNADGMSLVDAISLARGMTIIGGLLSTLLVIVAAELLLPDLSLRLVVALALGELLFIAFVDVAQAAVQATETLKLSVVMKAAQGGLRLVALVGLMLFNDDPSIELWGMLYLVAAALAAVVAYEVLARHVGRGVAGIVIPTWMDSREGIALTLGWGTERLRTDADKILLVRYGFGADAGLYGAATRLLQLAYVPIRGAVAASLAGFWRGADTSGAPAALARKLAAPAALYGVLTGVLLAVAAPLVPFVLGDGYGDTTEILWWLTPMPLLFALHAFPATALTSEGHNTERVWIVLGATALNIVLNVLLIPDYGWHGALGATLATETLMALALWLALNHFTPRLAPASRQMS